MNGGWGISYEIALRWMPLDLPDDKSTLVQVMAWCRQATSHYLSQCWPRSMSPNGISRPQRVEKKPAERWNLSVIWEKENQFFNFMISISWCLHYLAMSQPNVLSQVLIKSEAFKIFILDIRCTFIIITIHLLQTSLYETHTLSLDIYSIELTNQII